MDLAAAQFVVERKVGRVLTARWLSAAVAARNLGLWALSLGVVDASDHFAPEWVVITDRRTGRLVKRLNAGRSGDAQGLYGAVCSGLDTLSTQDFSRRWLEA